MGKKTWLGIAAVIAASGALLAAPAQARTSVAVSIGVPVYGYGYAQPVYSQPVYSQPYVYAQPVYSQPYTYVQPGYVVSEPVYVGPRYRHHHVRRDSDRDGVPDRFDRRPYNPRRY